MGLTGAFSRRRSGRATRSARGPLDVSERDIPEHDKGHGAHRKPVNRLERLPMWLVVWIRVDRDPLRGMPGPHGCARGPGDGWRSGPDAELRGRRDDDIRGA